MNSHLKIAAVVVAAGRGERAGIGDGPKQYRVLGGATVLQTTLDALLAHDQIAEVVTVIHPDDVDLYVQSRPTNSKLLPSTLGGATRQASVLAGLKALEGRDVDVVLIHDAARPFVSHELITRVIETAVTKSVALPALAVADTLKRSDDTGKVTETVSRDGLYFAQTPQGFTYSGILSAHEKAASEQLHSFTDDTSLAEWTGLPVHLVKGEAANIKLTTKTDIEEAQVRMSTFVPDIRVGHGYDTHQLIDGDGIRLCGIDVPFDKKLSGHSDADVGLHALTDALLGAIAAGDIGSHFPPSDPQWKGADSDQFLAHAAKLVDDAGGSITHCDVTGLRSPQDRAAP